MNANDFSEFFENLTPEMFAIETTASSEEQGRFAGSAAFDAFVEEHVRTVRMAFASNRGRINPIVTLANPTMRRSFAVTADENLGEFLERLSREASLMNAHWLFLAKESVFSAYFEPDDVDDGDVHDVASEDTKKFVESRESEAGTGIIWYAERREKSEYHHRHGILQTADGQIVRSIAGDERQSMGVFGAILDGVPLP